MARSPPLEIDPGQSIHGEARRDPGRWPIPGPHRTRFRRREHPAANTRARLSGSPPGPSSSTVIAIPEPAESSDDAIKTRALAHLQALSKNENTGLAPSPKDGEPIGFR
jgi:hypothetical protein